MSTITIEDINDLDSNNIFLALIEPRKLFTPEVEAKMNQILSDDNLARLHREAYGEANEEEALEICSYIAEIGYNGFIDEIRSDLFELICFLKENRFCAFSNKLAVLVPLNNGIYDFLSATYIDLEEYYVNYAIEFSKVFFEEDYEFIVSENGAQIRFSDDMDLLVHEFLDNHQKTIDKGAKSLILKGELYG